MLRAIEAIYENGKLNFLEKIDGIKKARVVVIFLDGEKKPEEKMENFVEEKLPEIRLSAETVKEYEEKLALAEERAKRKEIDLLQDPFLSLEPVDLGYTNANLLDSIIADEVMGKERI